jgi:hypothetical protein
MLVDEACEGGAELIGWGAFTAAFAFHGSALAHALEWFGTATGKHTHTTDGEPPLAVGLAEGELTSLGSGGNWGQLAFGEAFAAASVLSRAAAPGEVLCAPSVRAFASGELLTRGARVGSEGEFRVRGARVDLKNPWRTRAIEFLSRLRVAPLVGLGTEPSTASAGGVLVVRADAGGGGTRYLAELGARSQRALTLSPAGSTYEPLGSLRRAFARASTRERALIECPGPLDALLMGHGVSLEHAVSLVVSFLRPQSGAREGALLLLLDDAAELDLASLEVCVRVLAAEPRAGLVVRLDPHAELPGPLARVTGAGVPFDEVTLPRLDPADAEALARGVTSTTLERSACERWARLGNYTPLGIVEAVCTGIATGELRFVGDKAEARTRAAGRGKAREPADWIRRRSQDESEASRLVLCLVALLGGEASTTQLTEVLRLAGMAIEVEPIVEVLMRGRWLLDTQEDWVELAGRTYRDTFRIVLDPSVMATLHQAASVVFARDGVFGAVESAWHGSLSGDPAAAERFLAASRAATLAGFDESAAQLLGLALRAERVGRVRSEVPVPSRALLESVVVPRTGEHDEPHFSLFGSGARLGALVPEAVHGSSDLPGPEATGSVHDSEPPTLPGVPMFGAEPPRSGASLAPSGVPSVIVESAQGEGSLALDDRTLADPPSRLLRPRGTLEDAVGVLQRKRASCGPTEHARACQTSLALAVAFASAGRSEEALVEAMDALSSAKRAEDPRGAKACLAFLAKLYAFVGRDEAPLLRDAAQA